MKKTAFIAICSEEYLGYYEQLYVSLQKHSPDTHQVLYFIGQNIPTKYEHVIDITSWKSIYSDKLTHICSLRARVVLDAFDHGFNSVVFCGAKIEFFDSPFDLLDELWDYDAVATPHILEPLPEDGKFPSNATVSFTGHISTDLVGFNDTKSVRDFLKWQDEIMKTQCRTTVHTYLDQSWLNFLPFFVQNTLILQDPSYNVAYWNMFQRDLKKKDGRFKVNSKYLSDLTMTAFQYSGLDLNDCKNISKHQNRWTAEGDILEFLEDYARRVKGFNITSVIDKAL